MIQHKVGNIFKIFMIILLYKAVKGLINLNFCNADQKLVTMIILADL